MSPTKRDKLHERTVQLQSAISQVSSVRKILGKNSQEIKCQIQANISRQLEALRNREVWLLNQVDLLQSAKEDTLRSQQARLDTALGSASKALQIATDGEYDIDDCDDCLDTPMDELKPEETPHLTFQVNSVGLRENIVKYGKIDTVGFHDRSIFTGKHDESASLPKAFEDYEDADNHMLYKTVGAGRAPGSVSLPGSFRRARAATAPPSKGNTWLIQSPISPTSPTLLSPTLPLTMSDLSDWLRPAKPTHLLSPTVSPAKYRTTEAPPALQRAVSNVGHVSDTTNLRPVSDASKLRHVSSDASICSWLHQLKTSPHMEDDDFEVIDTMMAGNNSDKAVKAPTKGGQSCGYLPTQSVTVPERKPSLSDIFQRILAQDIALWLQTPNERKDKSTQSTAKPAPQFSGTPQQLSEVSRYYRMIAAQSNALWLINRISKHQEVPKSASKATPNPVNINDIVVELSDMHVSDVSDKDASYLMSMFNDSQAWLAGDGDASVRGFSDPQKREKKLNDAGYKEWIRKGESERDEVRITLDRLKAFHDDVVWLRGQGERPEYSILGQGICDVDVTDGCNVLGQDNCDVPNVCDVVGEGVCDGKQGCDVQDSEVARSDSGVISQGNYAKSDIGSQDSNANCSSMQYSYPDGFEFDRIDNTSFGLGNPSTIIPHLHSGISRRSSRDESPVSQSVKEFIRDSQFSVDSQFSTDRRFSRDSQFSKDKQQSTDSQFSRDSECSESVASFGVTTSTSFDEIESSVDAMSEISSYDDWLRPPVSMTTTQSTSSDWLNYARVKDSDLNLWLR